MDSPVKLGMTLDEVRLAVPDLEVTRFSDGYTDQAYAELELDGWEHNAHCEDNVVDHVWATRSISTFREGLELLEMLVAKHGSPGLVRTHDTRERFEWEWLAESEAFALWRETDSWAARWDVQRRPGLSTPTRTLTAAREIMAAVSQQLSTVRIGEGARGDAVARWRADLGLRREHLEHFLDVVAIATPQSPIAEFWLSALLEQAGWLARHDELFREPDDWRDAILLGDRADPRMIGWNLYWANEGGRAVRLVEGAFATGVLRVIHRVATEDLAPVGEIPLDVQVTITKPTYREDRPEKMKPDTATASLGGVTVELTGGSELARVARALVAVRAARAGR